jgi:hypothetical protein
MGHTGACVRVCWWVGGWVGVWVVGRVGGWVTRGLTSRGTASLSLVKISMACVRV